MAGCAEDSENGRRCGTEHQQTAKHPLPAKKGYRLTLIGLTRILARGTNPGT